MNLRSEPGGAGASVGAVADICWHPDGAFHHDCPGAAGDDRMLWIYGRCRSGQRWFWSAACYDWRNSADEEIMLHGWAVSEDGALAAARTAITAATSGRPAIAYPRQTVARNALKRINEAKRAARPPSRETGARMAEYLYEVWTFWPEDGPEVRKVRPWQIARRTAKRLYFTDGTFVSLEELDADTRCPGRTDSRYCKHGCWNSHGYPAGEMMKGGRSRSDLVHLFTTREAAEDYLFRTDREQERQQAGRQPELKRLRKAMADAHPDRGGTSEGFITARKAYERALRKAS